MSKLLKKKKKKKSLKDQIAAEQSTGKKKDLRMLNYYDMKDGDKMTVLLVPFEEGELWYKERIHGPNLKHKGESIRGVGGINCSYASSGEECPACQVGFDLLNMEKETGDKSFKEEAKKWFARNRTFAQVIVLETPVEIQQDETHNEVKLWLVPYGIEKMILNTIQEGIVPEDEIFMTPLVIKKEGGTGGVFANYDNSYFARKPVDDETLEAFDDLVVEPYSIESLVGDVFAAPTTTKEVQEWTDKAEDLYMTATGQADDSDDEEDDTPPPRKTRKVDDEEEEAPKAKSSVASRLGARTAPKKEEPAYDEDVPVDLGNQEEEQEEAPKAKPTSSIRDRVSRLKRG